MNIKKLVILSFKLFSLLFIFNTDSAVKNSTNLIAFEGVDQRIYSNGKPSNFYGTTIRLELTNSLYNKEQFICLACKQEYHNTKAARDHLRLVHNARKIERIYDNTVERPHTLNPLASDSSSTSLSSTSYSSSDLSLNLPLEEFTCLDQEKFRCKICKTGYNSIKSARDHLRKKHSTETLKTIFENNSDENPNTLNPMASNSSTLSSRASSSGSPLSLLLAAATSLDKSSSASILKDKSKHEHEEGKEEREIDSARRINVINTTPFKIQYRASAEALEPGEKKQLKSKRGIFTFLILNGKNEKIVIDYNDDMKDKVIILTLLQITEDPEESGLATLVTNNTEEDKLEVIQKSQREILSPEEIISIKKDAPLKLILKNEDNQIIGQTIFDKVKKSINISKKFNYIICS